MRRPYHADECPAVAGPESLPTHSSGRVEADEREGPARFRKKPVEIEAMHYKPGAGGNCVAVHDWLGLEHDEATCWDNSPLMILTLEGEMEARPGDWIIKGIQDEFYPCKPEIFEATYEPV
jgi:hypothetical protein